MISPTLLMRNLLFMKISPVPVIRPGPQRLFSQYFLYKCMYKFMNFKDALFHAKGDYILGPAEHSM